MTLIEEVSWDSDFFGYKIGRVECDFLPHFNLENLILNISDFKLVYVFSSTPLDLQYRELNLVDEKVTFDLKISSKIKVANNIDIISCRKIEFDRTHLDSLAIESGVYSRFKVDPNFLNNEFEKLYLEWMKQSLAGKQAFDVLIAREESQILGFITIGEKNETTSSIGLIAVDEKARGRGIAKELVVRAVNLSFEKGYSNIEVVTQKNNEPAMNLYKRVGFKVKDIKNIYHIWNK